MTGAAAEAAAEPVLVTGGTGTLGRLVVQRLRAAGRDVRVLSRRPAPAGGAPGWHVGDLGTGAGLGAALDGVGAVVHCATRPRGDADVVAAGHLLDAALAAGRPHLVVVSIVGADRVPYSYYRAKHRVEQLLPPSGLPWTLLRATQFHELVDRACTALTRLPVVPVPAGTSFQPVAAAEVADRLVELVGGPAAGRVPDLGGPEVLGARDLVRTHLRASGSRRAVLPVHLPGAVFAGYRAGGHLAPDRAVGRTTFAQHLVRRGG